MPQAGGSGFDAVHRLMEPAHPVPKAPRLKSPYGGGGLVGRVLSPRTALLAVPASMVAMAFTAPDMLAKLLLHIYCFFASLIEPFDPLVRAALFINAHHLEPRVCVPLSLCQTTHARSYLCCHLLQLPDKGPLRTMVKTVKGLKRQWYRKQGLPDPGDTSFMDDDDDEDDFVSAAEKAAMEKKEAEGEGGDAAEDGAKADSTDDDGGEAADDESEEDDGED